MPREKDNSIYIKFDKFYQAFSPAHFKNSLSSFGNAGHANAMQNIDILVPEYLTQGPGLAALTNGTQAGVVSELIKFILDRAVAASQTYGIGNTKLFRITPTAVSDTGTWPHTISGASRGESIFLIKGKLYYVYQNDFGSFDLSSTFDDNYGSTVPTGAASLQDAPHPTAVKEDIALIGNGRYLATFIASTETLAPTKLDFGNNFEVADILFHNNKWLIAVNTTNADDDNRGLGYLYWYDGAAVSTLLDDEASVGIQKIGFVKVINGIVFIAFQDLSSSGGYKLGYLSGNRIITLGHFTGSLPTFRQKTLYKNLLLFLSNFKIWAAGSSVGELPYALSQLADAGYDTNVGSLAAPFGTPMVASDDGSNYQLAKFSGYDVNCNWTTLIVEVSVGKNLGYIKEMIVTTEALGSGARCDITLQYNDNNSNSEAKEISTEGDRKHVVRIGDSDIENVRAYINTSNGSASNPVKIKSIELIGHFTESQLG